jgi:prepilin-type N-terminal cleavage/methylation domain-containing protein
MKKSGFSLVELIIVIAIIMILAAAGLTGYGSISTNLRFNNTFNRIIQMVEQARSMAVTGKGTAGGYGVHIKNDIENDTVELFSSNPDDASTYSALSHKPIDSEIIKASAKLELKATTEEAMTCSTATIFFERNTSKTSLYCIAIDLKTPPVLKIELSTSDASKTKSFSIHKAAGIPQL